MLLIIRRDCRSWFGGSHFSTIISIVNCISIITVIDINLTIIIIVINNIIIIMLLFVALHFAETTVFVAAPTHNSVLLPGHGVLLLRPSLRIL